MDLPDVLVKVEKEGEKSEEWKTIFELQVVHSKRGKYEPKVGDVLQFGQAAAGLASFLLDLGDPKKLRPKIKVHWSMLILLIPLISTLATSGIQAALTLLGLWAALYTFVTLHELGHMFAASRLGYPTGNILLTPIGGLAIVQMEMPPASHELIVALAGPLVNVILAGLFALVWWAFPVEVVLTLLMLNIILFAFNIFVFAFPMDGGRIFRSILRFCGLDFRKATKVAIYVSFILLGGLGILGVFIGHFFMVIIAVFLSLLNVKQLKTLG